MVKGKYNRLFQTCSLIVVILLFALIIGKLFYVAVSPTVDGVNLKNSHYQEQLLPKQ